MTADATSRGGPGKDPPVVELQGVTKRFGRVQALSSVDLSIHPGEVVGLVGANGSGKSTLVKILAGVHHPDAGMVLLRGTALGPTHNPSAAHASGMYFVYQDAPLLENLNVVENMAWLGTGYVRSRFGRVRWRAQRELATAALAGFAHAPRLDATANELSPPERTTVALAALLQAARGAAPFLVLDEPTASLPAHESARVIESVRAARDRGAGVVFISHRLDEVIRLCDRVVVLRDGRVQAVLSGEELTTEVIIRHMLGRLAGSVLNNHAGAHSAGASQVRLSVSGLTGNRISDTTFSVAAGAIVGVGGILGCGRSELGRLLAGVQQWTRGEVIIDGRVHRRLDVRRAHAAKVAYVPSDRGSQAVIASMSVAENLLMRPGRWPRRAWAGTSAERRMVEPLIERFGVRPADPDLPIGSLSGGNQQKCVLAKWVEPAPAVLILDEPTLGVDVGAKSDIYDVLRMTAANGTGVLLLSSEPEELAAVCTSVLILREGRLVTHLQGGEITEETIVDATYA